MPNKTIEDFANQVKAFTMDKLWGAEVAHNKNIFNFNTIISDSNNGITMTVTKNQYGEIEEIDLDGTATASFAFTIKDFTSELLPEGTFVLSDEGGFVEGTYPNATGAYTYFPRKKGSSGTINTSIQTANSNHAKQFTVDYDEFDYFALQIYIWTGTVLDHLKLRPMICTLADWNASHTYEPYYVPVKDRMTELETTEALSDSEFTPAANVTITKNWSAKWGKLIQVALLFHVSAEISANTEIFTMPNYKLANGKTGGTVMCAPNILLNGAPSTIITCDMPAGDGPVKFRNLSNLANGGDFKITMSFICK